MPIPSIVPCRSSLNTPASIEAVCDLLEEVVKLDPSLIQVRVWFYALPVVLHHCMWYLEALVGISHSNGILCKPILGDLTDGLSCYSLNQPAKLSNAGQVASDI